MYIRLCKIILFCQLITYTIVDCFSWTHSPHGIHYYLNNEPRDYFSARETCAKNGGQLVKIQSVDIANWLIDWVKSQNDEKAVPFWIGLKQRAFHKYVWLDSSKLEYVNWPE